MRSRRVRNGVVTLIAVLVGVNAPAIGEALTRLGGDSTKGTDLSAGPPPVLLQESPACDAPLEAAPPTAAPAPIPSGGTRVTFTVPPTTSVMTDGSGSVVSVRTNTGCAPAAGDEMWEIAAAGAAPISAALRERILSHPYEGDWTTPGEWHSVAPIRP